MRARQARRARGAALIEFVLVLPLFLTILLGTIDWGWYFVIREIATNATREGARVGAVSANAGAAYDAARTATWSYLQNALGEKYAAYPTVDTSSACTVAGSRCVSVTLEGFRPVPGADRSITGLQAWTHAPTAFTVRTDMRLEVQP